MEMYAKSFQAEGMAFLNTGQGSDGDRGAGSEGCIKGSVFVHEMKETYRSRWFQSQFFFRLKR